jgi:hypothetical protein
MQIPRPSQEVVDELDAALAEVLAEYARAPYEGRDPHGLFPHLEQIVRRLHPDWADFKVTIMATAATADIAADLIVAARTAEQESKSVTWREI